MSLFTVAVRSEQEELASCYRACLELAAQNGISSVAFCCISMGEFHFPNELAAQITVKTVRKFLTKRPEMAVVFNVFKDQDLDIYQQL